MHSLFVDASEQLLACGKGRAVGRGDAGSRFFDPVPVDVMPGVQVRSVADTGLNHSLALCWDERVFSWGSNDKGQLGHGDTHDRLSPALVEELESVRGIDAGNRHSLAVTHAGAVFSWGKDLQSGGNLSLRPTIVEGFGGVCVRRVYVGRNAIFTIGEDGELFSWGHGDNDEVKLLGHGDTEYQTTPKRVEALRGVRVSSVGICSTHALALTADGGGLVYGWGQKKHTMRIVLCVVWCTAAKCLAAARVSRAASAGGAKCRCSEEWYAASLPRMSSLMRGTADCSMIHPGIPRLRKK